MTALPQSLDAGQVALLLGCRNLSHPLRTWLEKVEAFSDQHSCLQKTTILKSQVVLFKEAQTWRKPTVILMLEWLDGFLGILLLCVQKQWKCLATDQATPGYL